MVLSQLEERLLRLPVVCTREQVSHHYCVANASPLWHCPTHVMCDDCEEFDTSLLALMVEWLKRAQREGVSVRFSGISPELEESLRVHHVWSIFQELGVLVA